MEISKSDLEKLSETRLREAGLLLENKLYSGAYYIAGYSVELALKACIAKNFRANVMPDIGVVTKLYIHDLEKLIKFAGLEQKLLYDRKNNPTFDKNWMVVNDWSEEARYEIWDIASATELI